MVIGAAALWEVIGTFPVRHLLDEFGNIKGYPPIHLQA